MQVKAYLCRVAACGAVVAVGLWAPKAQAVIIYGGNGVDAPANDTAPAGFEDAWARVGKTSNGTAVYLGNGFALSAAHVSLGTSIAFDGVDYTRVGGTTFLLNPNASEADLRLFRLALPEGSPLRDLDALGILDTSLATNAGNKQEGVLIGTGVGQTTLQPIALAPEGGPIGNGFVWDDPGSREKRWAEAEIGAPTNIPAINGRTVQEAFESDFKFNAGQDGIAADNDSGAALFYDNGSEVVLAGLVHSVTRLDYAKQNDTTFFSDLAEYADQIVITPGDLDGDGYVDQADLNLVLNRFGKTAIAGNWFQGDPTGDGVVGVDDLDYVLARWGNGQPPAVSAPVPEPTGMLLISGAPALLASRRRRS